MLAVLVLILIARAEILSCSTFVDSVPKGNLKFKLHCSSAP